MYVKFGPRLQVILERKSLVLILHTKNVCKIRTKRFKSKMYVKFVPRGSTQKCIHTKNVCKMCTKTSSHFRTKKLGTNFTYKKCM